MILLYNEVPLDVTRLLSHSAECVYDESGTDLLFIKHQISVEALIGYGSQAFVLEVDPPDPRRGPKPRRLQNPIGDNRVNGLVRRRKAAFGAESADAIRHALAQPRKPFALFDFKPDDDAPFPAAETLLFSDGLDANNGPKPIGPVSVLAVHGSASLYFVRFDIEVCINQCPLKGPGDTDPQKQPFGLLGIDDITVFTSNRWTSSVIYAEEDAAVTYRIQGRATARSDALAAFGIASLDQFRGGLLPNPVKNCKRYIRQLDMSADGLSFEYTVDDVEQFRVYLDIPTAVPGGKAVKDPNTRNVESVDLIVEKTFSVPSAGKAASRFIEQLQTANFAIGEAKKEGASGLEAIGEAVAGEGGAKAVKGVRKTATAAGKGGKAATKFLGIGGTLATAIAKTVDDDVIPTYSESATARVQLNRHGRMQDAQALCFALISGALNYGTTRDPKRNGNLNWLLLPAQTVTLTYNPVQGWVQASMSVVRSGLLDFTAGTLRSSIATMIEPIDDYVEGGKMPFSLLNFAALLGDFELADLLEANIWKFVKDRLLKANVEDFFSIPGRETLSKYTGNLLLTEKDEFVRGLTYDGVSRTAADVLIRTAAALLGQCDSPSSSFNLDLPHLPRRGGSKPTSMLPPLKTGPTTPSQTFTASAASGVKSLEQLLAKWKGQLI